jgi:hypothetical protein
MMVFSSLLFVLFSGSLRSLCIQFLNVVILCSPEWHEVLFTVRYVVAGYISIVPCLSMMFRSSCDICFLFSSVIVDCNALCCSMF